MESTQSTQRRVRYQFEIFCMKVIDGERCDYLRKLMKKMEWESSFSDLPETVLTSLCTFDSDPAEQYIFHVYGHQIPIRNDRLAEILLALGDEGYSILLLYYSLQLKDREIASLLGLSRSKIQKDRKILFNELKKRMVEYQIEREYQELTQAMLKYNDPFWWLTVVFKEAGFTEVERNPNDVALSIELSYYNNYYEDMILELLNTLVPFTAEGFISYRGEEGDLWCHVFAGGEWTERSGRICYDEPRPQFEESKQNLERLIEEIRRQVIYDDRPYEDKARDLLKAFEAHDPDGVLLALSGRRLHEHGVAAGIWQDGGESAHPDERE